MGNFLPQAILLFCLIGHVKNFAHNDGDAFVKRRSWTPCLIALAKQVGVAKSVHVSILTTEYGVLRNERL